MIIAKLRDKLNSDAHFAELVKGSGTAFILRIVGIGAGYLFTLLVTRTLGAKAWGIFALSLVVLQIASVIGRLGMDTALLRFTAEYTAKGEIGTLKEIYKKALTLVVPFSILVAISVYFLSPILADKVFHKPYLADYFRIVSFIIVPFVLLFINSESIRGLKKIKEYMLLQQSGIFIIALVFFLIGSSFMKSHFLPLISYSISILILAITSIYLWRKYLIYKHFKTSTPFPPSTTPTPSTTSKASTTSYKSILSVSIPMLLSGSLALIMGWTDTVMLGMFRSAQEVGIYNVVLKLSIPFSVIWVSLNSISAPKFARLRSNKKELGILVAQSSNLLFFFSILYMISILIFREFMLKLFGNEFVKASEALVIISVGYLIKNSLGLSIDLMNVTDLYRYLSLINSFVVLLNIILNYILIRMLGINGAAASTAICLATAAIFRYFLIRKKVGVSTLPTFLRGKLMRGRYV